MPDDGAGVLLEPEPELLPLPLLDDEPLSDELELLLDDEESLDELELPLSPLPLEPLPSDDELLDVESEPPPTGRFLVP